MAAGLGYGAVMDASGRARSPAEARAYLVTRGVPEHLHAHIAALACDDEQALTTLADVALADPQGELDWESQPASVQRLLASLLGTIPDELHQHALWCSAILLRTNEEVLARLLGAEHAHALFAWLHGLACMQADGDGVYPDDLTRALLDANVRWRRPQWRRTTLNRIAAHYVESMRKAPSLRHAAIRAVWFAWRDELRYFQPDMLHAAVTSPRPHDWPALDAMLTRHFGPSSARLCHAWVERGAILFVARDATRAACGLALFIALDRVDAADVAFDPGVAALHAALGPSGREGARYMRLFVDHDRGQHASPTAAAISAYSMERAISTPGVTNVYSAWTPPDLGLHALGKGAAVRLPAGDFSLDGRDFGIMKMTVDSRTMVDWFVARYIAPLAATDDAAPHLSPRQRQTLALLIEGKTEKEVAAALDLSTHTVHQYVKGLYRAFDVTNRGALVARALRHGSSV